MYVCPEVCGLFENTAQELMHLRGLDVTEGANSMRIEVLLHHTTMLSETLAVWQERERV